MLKQLILITSAIVLLSGCASRPDSISASYVSHEKYIDNECSVLDTKMANARSQLTDFSSKQTSMANADAVGVFLVLIPVSQLAGDHEAAVAKWKGEIEAIETAQIKNKCV